MKKIENGTRIVRLEAEDGYILHRRGSEDFPEIGSLTTFVENVDDWEEIPVADVPAYGQEEYSREVERLIAERYSTGQEIQFAREREEAGEKYAAYLEYVAACKEQARMNLSQKIKGEEEEAELSLLQNPKSKEL